jgi:hypothetical protein
MEFLYGAPEDATKDTFPKTNVKVSVKCIGTMETFIEANGMKVYNMVLVNYM